MQDDTERTEERTEEAPAAEPSISEFLTANQTDPRPDATPEGSAGLAPEAGSEQARESIEASAQPYYLGTWSGVPAVFCNWPMPDGTRCSAGFLDEEAFWSHNHDHIIRAMTPEERAALVADAKRAAGVSVIVGADGLPIR